VLTFRCAEMAFAKLGLTKLGLTKLDLTSWPPARLSAAAALSVMMLGLIWSAAYADGIIVGGCVGEQGALNCVARWGAAQDPYIRKVPEPTDDAERARSAQRDQKWEARCRPVIAQDHYGVPRYQYAAPGCEFGIIE
jgi:hypothetical protein